MIYFYKKFKDDIKNNLYREDIPDTFIEYIQRIIKIDNRLYIQRIKKYNQRPSTLR